LACEPLPDVVVVVAMEVPSAFVHAMSRGQA
jgi:hypothetical protein